MSERTDALIWQGRMRDLRDEIAAIEAERDGLRVEFNQLRELSRMEKEALIGASKAVERILRARVTELEAALDRIAGLYLHEGVTQDDETTVRKMYETALAALGRA